MTGPELQQELKNLEKNIPIIFITAQRNEAVRARVLEQELQELRDRYAGLTPRERDVMKSIVTGMLNKQVGLKLDISEITVKAHRGKVMQK